jgi:hypothetical protein
MELAEVHLAEGLRRRLRRAGIASAGVAAAISPRAAFAQPPSSITEMRQETRRPAGW